MVYESKTALDVLACPNYKLRHIQKYFIIKVLLRDEEVTLYGKIEVGDDLDKQ